MPIDPKEHLIELMKIKVESLTRHDPLTGEPYCIGLHGAETQIRVKGLTKVKRIKHVVWFLNTGRWPAEGISVVSDLPNSIDFSKMIPTKEYLETIKGALD